MCISIMPQLPFDDYCLQEAFSYWPEFEAKFSSARRTLTILKVLEHLRGKDILLENIHYRRSRKRYEVNGRSVEEWNLFRPQHS